jgi:hypothetical protein
MPDIVERWMWRDPGEIIDRLLVRSARASAPRVDHDPANQASAAAGKDRYYTQARQLEIRQCMKRVTGGKR